MLSMQIARSCIETTLSPLQLSTPRKPFLLLDTDQGGQGFLKEWQLRQLPTLFQGLRMLEFLKIRGIWHRLV
ncbi:hypothetical protein SLE2022_339710 [Rubroshorea leprosula]